jgi:hypothetical protein
MADLDTLLQDFSYLKSLEHRNEAPKKLSKKLLLPDVSYAVTAFVVSRRCLDYCLAFSSSRPPPPCVCRGSAGCTILFMPSFAALANLSLTASSTGL